MGIRPILSAMGRNKFGAILIATQIAVTLAFLANALTLVEHRIEWSDRPSGLDEKDIFIISPQIIDPVSDLAARQIADIEALRSMAGVVDAFSANMYPLQGGGWIESIALTANQKVPNALSSYYMGDEHALNTLGLTLVAGRNFTATDVIERTENSQPDVGALIVTKALATQLFPKGDALGKSIYAENEVKSSPIVGIVDRLEGPVTAATGLFSTFAENSVIVPYRLIQAGPRYMVRTQPGQRDAVMKAAEAKLLQMDDNRLISSQSMLQVRADAYRGDHGLVVLLVSICTALVLVTAFGIIGLTSYWVAQRRQQIGIRRALGATRRAIVQYFQTENLMIGVAGALVGIAFASALNLWMVRSFEMVRMDNSRAMVGAVFMLVLGQIAVFWPALRAASIPPALATRGG
jgi:putative ABC transport system permease protein